MQKITPHLWYNKKVREAAEFYTSVFSRSKIKSTTTLHNTPSVGIGTAPIIVFVLLSLSQNN